MPLPKTAQAIGPKPYRRTLLLSWRRKQFAKITAKQLADSLSCESLPYDQLPPYLYAALVEFRHLRQDARVAACKAWLERQP